MIRILKTTAFALASCAATFAATAEAQVYGWPTYGAAPAYSSCPRGVCPRPACATGTCPRPAAILPGGCVGGNCNPPRTCPPGGWCGTPAPSAPCYGGSCGYRGPVTTPAYRLAPAYNPGAQFPTSPYNGGYPYYGADSTPVMNRPASSAGRYWFDDNSASLPADDRYDTSFNRRENLLPTSYRTRDLDRDYGYGSRDDSPFYP